MTAGSLRWIDWGSRPAADSGVRGGEAKEEMRNRGDGKKKKKKKKTKERNGGPRFHE